MTAKTLTPENVIVEARSLLGVRYAHQGRDPRHGLDCIGLLIVPLLRCGWKPRDPRTLTVNYDEAATDDLMERLLRKEGREVKTIKRGDVLLFRFPDEKFPHHVGMVTEIRNGTPYFIHTTQQTGAVEHGLRAEWTRWCRGIYRMKDFKNG